MNESWYKNFHIKAADQPFKSHSQFHNCTAMAARTIALLLLGFALHVSIDLDADLYLYFLRHFPYFVGWFNILFYFFHFIRQRMVYLCLSVEDHHHCHIHHHHAADSHLHHHHHHAADHHLQPLQKSIVKMVETHWSF